MMKASRPQLDAALELVDLDRYPIADLDHGPEVPDPVPQNAGLQVQTRVSRTAADG